MREELGDDVGRLFERFDAEPLAAASLGQVHRAAYQGREVVVKVLRPGVEDMVGEDLDVSFRILFLLNLLFPNHHTRAITAIVSEFAKRIARRARLPGGGPQRRDPAAQLPGGAAASSCRRS